jgi:endonuclease/exonuclease/phosphatase family metal-dependent hydrolase
MLRMIGTFVAGGVAAALLYPRLAGTVPSSAALDERPVALYTQKLIELQRRGEKFPRGKDAKEQVGALCLCSCARGYYGAHENPLPVRKTQMYAAFVKEASMVDSHSRAPPLPAPGALRMLTWNIHFWRRGYSALELGDNTAEVVACVRSINPDVLLLQEVVDTNNELKVLADGLGYQVCQLSASPDVHTLPPDQESYAGERLHVAVLARAGATVTRREAVPMAGGSGHASLAVIHTGGAAPTAAERTGGGGNDGNDGNRPPARRAVAFYSVHLSVRCDAALRRQEIASVVAHSEALTDVDLVVIAGDLNQVPLFFFFCFFLLLEGHFTYLSFAGDLNQVPPHSSCYV